MLFVKAQFAVVRLSITVKLPCCSPFSTRAKKKQNLPKKNPRPSISITMSAHPQQIVVQLGCRE